MDGWTDVRLKLELLVLWCGDKHLDLDACFKVHGSVPWRNSGQDVNQEVMRNK